jgi:predicted TPR repeat methyltransferase
MGNALREDGRPEEAIPYYVKALEIEPNDAETYNNLGVAFKDKSDLNEAISCFQKALRLKPGYVAATINIGMALQEKGAAEEAIAVFRHVIALDPENVSARYLLASLTGETIETAPQQYVVGLFDWYAKWFDRHLEEELEYEAPRLLRKSLDSLVTDHVRFNSALDLGCGTGLSGAAFRTISECLSGIDVSSKMVQQARKKGIYDRLYVQDIVSYLLDTDERFDLFIAADVFIYIGDLKPVFDVVRNCRLGRAYFLFSTESHDGSNYILQQTGRYAHAGSYIQSLAKQHGFEVETNRPAVIRKERGKGIMGRLFILRYGVGLTN